MKLHANAKLSPNGRRLLIDRLETDGWDIGDAANAAGITVRTARKWLARWRAEGELGLVDRSSAPKTVANKTDEARVACIAALRRLRMTGPEIAEVLQMALSTVSGILKSIDMGKLGRLGLEPARRYERARPGELIHVDVKKLGRIIRAGHRITGVAGKRQAGYHRNKGSAGWEFCHVAIDDATRLAYVEVLADEKAVTAAGFLRRAKAFFESYGMTVESVMTDNGGRLPLHHPRPGLQDARAQAPAHPCLPTPDQRQSRTLHPHDARRLGLRRDLHQQLRPRRSP
jgi:transposase